MCHHHTLTFFFTWSPLEYINCPYKTMHSTIWLISNMTSVHWFQLEDLDHVYPGILPIIVRCKLGGDFKWLNSCTHNKYIYIYFQFASIDMEIFINTANPETIYCISGNYLRLLISRFPRISGNRKYKRTQINDIRVFPPALWFWHKI